MKIDFVWEPDWQISAPLTWLMQQNPLCFASLRHPLAAFFLLHPIDARPEHSEPANLKRICGMPNTLVEAKTCYSEGNLSNRF
jgi:hypothetical protein